MSLRDWMIRRAFGGGKEGLNRLAIEWTRQMWKANLWVNNKWLGMEIWQWPTDLFIMQELIFEQKPKIIVETGTARGGSSIFYASLLSMINGKKVVSVDIEHSNEIRKTISEHQFGGMVVLITGDSKSDEIVAQVREELAGEERVLVTLDSDHSYRHVLGELNAYCEFVPVGGYLVAMDTICLELSELEGYEKWANDNPMRAVEEFLSNREDFEVDKSRNRMLVGFSPGGFLRRIK